MLSSLKRGEGEEEEREDRREETFGKFAGDTICAFSH